MIDVKSLGKCDLHMHTVYCDGKSTPEEMVLSAIEKGLDTVGVAAHSYLAKDSECYIQQEDVPRFQAEVNALKIKYADKIRVLCGIEQEYFSETSTNGFDYVIGSLHYFNVDGEIYSVDLDEETFLDRINTHFNGDFYSAAENYYQTLADVVEKTGADIIGHFDLVTKYNDGDKYFDTKHPRYVNAYKKALAKLIKTGKPFEINTGVISRGYRKQPYPSSDIIKEIKAMGGTLILSSDSHHEKNVAYQFDIWQKLL